MNRNFSIRSKLLLSLLLLNISVIVVTGVIFGNKFVNEIETAYNKNATDQLDSILNNIITQHQSIEFYKERVFKNRELEIKANVEIIMSSVEICYKEYLAGILTMEEAKNKAIKIVKNSRFNNNVGYFWINDTGRPFPKMIMHPTVPELDGQILDDPDFNCALGRGENLFKAFVDVTEFDDEGYVDYLWPKPTDSGLTEIQPKISYVRIFRPWNWIIGTGVYIDDIEKESEKRVEKVIEELNETMTTLKVGEYGYFFVFNSDSDMLVHPNLAGLNISNYNNPITGIPITAELMETVNRGDSVHTYLWDKPGFEGKYIYKKSSFVKYFEPLDWYITSSVYYDDYMRVVYETVRYIFYVSFIFITVIILLSVVISGKLTKPLKQLMEFIDNRDSFGIPTEKVPLIPGKEFNDLRVVINGMIQSVIRSRELLEAHKDNLEKLVSIRTKELESSLDSLKAAQKQLIESEKIASLGGLVAGVAHEINTPLGVGITAASFLEEKTADLSELLTNGQLTKKVFNDYIKVSSQSSQIILNNILKVSDLIKSFKQIAVDTNIEDKRLLNLREYFSEIVKSMSSIIKVRDCEIVNNLQDSIDIYSYPTAISIIFINLITNSITHGFKGSKDGNKIIVDGSLESGNVEIVYYDNGIGILKSDIDKIFEPFFTTNRYEGNKGLGLNVVYNVVRQKLKGSIKASRDTKKGVKFIISFPAETYIG